MVALPNMKQLGQKILKAADDTSEAYNKFAKRQSVGGVEVRTCRRIWLCHLLDHEGRRTINRCFKPVGCCGPASDQARRVPYRSEPVRAISRGVGRATTVPIALRPEIGEEIVEKLAGANGKSGRRGLDALPEAPWQFVNARNDRKRLAGMGIEKSRGSSAPHCASSLV